MRRRLLRMLIGLGLATFIAYWAVAIYAADKFTHVERHAIDRRVAERVGVGFGDATFRTTDGLTLRGWVFPGTIDRAIVLVHGKDGTRMDTRGAQDLARTFAAKGYTVLAFDMRGHGESDGDRFSLGEYERFDVAAAVDFLVKRGIPQGHIVLRGESMGAGTVLQTLFVDPDVGPVIADSAYEAGTLIVDEKASSQTGLPPIITPGIILAARLFGVDVATADPIGAVRANPRRDFLFVHCAQDELIDVHHARDLRAASASTGSELWIVDGCGHVGAYEADAAAYIARVVRFVEAEIR